VRAGKERTGDNWRKRTGDGRGRKNWRGECWIGGDKKG
jgi:hypothetical protein